MQRDRKRRKPTVGCAKNGQGVGGPSSGLPTSWNLHSALLSSEELTLLVQALQHAWARARVTPCLGPEKPEWPASSRPLRFPNPGHTGTALTVHILVLCSVPSPGSWQEGPRVSSYLSGPQAMLLVSQLSPRCPVGHKIYFIKYTITNT